MTQNAAIDAGMGKAARSGERRERRRRPGDAERLAPSARTSAGGVQLMRAIRVARPLRPPWVRYGPGDLQRLFDLAVVAPHLAPVERPVGAVAELGAGLEPFGPEAQRHHGEMHGRAADRLARVVLAELQRIFAVDDPVVGPVEFRLLALVGGEILQRPPIGAGVERDDGEAIFGELAGERAAAGARSRRWRNRPPRRRSSSAWASSRPSGRRQARGRLWPAALSCGSSNSGIFAPRFVFAAG